MSDYFEQDGGIDRYTILAQELSTTLGPEGPPGNPYPGPGVKENTTIVGANIGPSGTLQLTETLFYEDELGADDIIQVEWWGQGNISGALNFEVYWNNILFTPPTPTITFPASYNIHLAEINSNSLFLTLTGNSVSFSSETAIGQSITKGGTLVVLLRSASSNVTVSSNTRIIKISQ